MESFTLVFNASDLQILSRAIGEIPTKFGKPLLDKINMQIAGQKANSDAPFGVGSAVATHLNAGT